MKEGWKDIATAPKDGRGIIVGYDTAGVWIVHSAAYMDWEEWMDDMPEAFDRSDVGWWSYTENSVGQSKIEPTHWLCETNAPEDT